MNKEPIFKTREAFSVVGIERYTANGIADIREAWGEIGARFNDVKNILMPPVAYGVEDYSRDFDMNAGGFPKYYYIAGFEVTNTNDIPEGMKLRDIPAANYAVFSYEGPMSKLPEFFGFIYGQWIPASEYKMDPALSLDYERYPEKMTDMENARLEIWVPVVKK